MKICEWLEKKTSLLYFLHKQRGNQGVQYGGRQQIKFRGDSRKIQFV